jgi:hypothetical protein
MKLSSRLLIYSLPIVFASLSKATFAIMAGGKEAEFYKENPAKLVDVSVDLLLTAAAIFLGLAIAFAAAAAPPAPPPAPGPPIKHLDLVICGSILVGALILMYAVVALLPSLAPGVGLSLGLKVSTIWIPDAIGIIAFAWIIYKLT